MNFVNFLSKQFIDIIQWNEEQGSGILAYRFPMQDMEIQNGGSLTVRETQKAMFVNEGKVADIFDAGLYKLTTGTLPILTYLKNWDKAFESPFKSDVFFFTTREQIDQRWGTPQPITIRDPEFGALRIRANGTYSYKIVDVGTFWSKLSGTVETYTVENAEGQLRAAILTSMASLIGSSGVPFLDMAANQSAFSDKLKTGIAPAFTNYGLELTSFYLQSLSLPEEVQERLDKASSMRIVGDMGKYTQFEAAESLPAAAANPGGVAGAGIGMGAGLAMGQMMANAVGNSAANQTAHSAQPGTVADPVAMIERLGELLQKGVLTQAEFDAKKTELLQQIR
jgi:membrane protease subunit (stomatin/prohibitin family)